jgi:hypothetical protein
MSRGQVSIINYEERNGVIHIGFLSSNKIFPPNRRIYAYDPVATLRLSPVAVALCSGTLTCRNVHANPGSALALTRIFHRGDRF